MVYQTIAKPSSRSSQTQKKDNCETAPSISVQAKSVSASPQEQEMPSYIPLAANWATNNNLMRSQSGTSVVQREEESGKEEIEPIQAKLTIGQVGDKYEQEADQTAQRVVDQINAPAPQPSTQGQSLQREEVPEEELQMQPMVQCKSDVGGMDATPDLEASIQQAKGGGQPLAENIRKPMEQAFGANFSKVKVHTDTTSDQLNQSIQAKAFTTEHDIFFRQGAYDPDSRGGQELLAHELTHVVQQNTGVVQRMKPSGIMEKIGSVPDFYKQINQLGQRDMTRHHIVPKDTLMNFYNTVRGCGDLAALKGVLTDLATNSLTKYGFEGLSFEQFQAAKKERYGEKATATEDDWKDAEGRTQDELHDEISNLTSNQKPNDTAAAALIEKMYQWFPGNLVIGPGGRTDDPGSKFEVNAGKLLPQEDFNNLKLMYEQMELYIEKAKTPQPKKKGKGQPQPVDNNERTAALNQVIQCLKKAMQKTEPYAYDESKWDLGEGGPKIAEQAVHLLNPEAEQGIHLLNPENDPVFTPQSKQKTSPFGPIGPQHK